MRLLVAVALVAGLAVSQPLGEEGKASLPGILGEEEKVNPLGKKESKRLLEESSRQKRQWRGFGGAQAQSQAQAAGFGGGFGGGGFGGAQAQSQAQAAGFGGGMG